MAEGEDGLRVALLEEREGVLHPLVARQPLERGDLEGLGELLGGEVRSSDGTDRAVPDELVERGERLLLRDVGVEVVRQVEGHALDPQPAQARLELTPDAGCAEPVVGALGHRVEGLRHDHDAVPHVGPLRPEPGADVVLAAPAAVRVRGVERRDPHVPRGVEQPKGVLARRPLAEERRCRADPAEVAAAEDDSRDGDAAPPECALLHAPIVRRAAGRPSG